MSCAEINVNYTECAEINVDIQGAGPTGPAGLTPEEHKNLINQTNAAKNAATNANATNEAVKAAEKVREENENTRKANEDARNTAFKNSQAANKAAFDAAQTERSETFKAAETARLKAFNEAQGTRDTAFKAAEADRANTFKTAEEQRAKNETARKSAETKRKNAETERERLSKEAVEKANTAASGADAAAGRADSSTLKADAAADRANAAAVKVEPFAGNQLRNTVKGELIHVDDAYTAKPSVIKTLGKTSVNLAPVFPDYGTDRGVKWTSNKDGSVGINGTPTGPWRSIFVDIYLQPGKTYTLSSSGTVGDNFSSVGAAYVNVNTVTTTGTSKDYITIGNKPVTFTTPEDLQYSRLYVSLGQDTTTERNTTVYPMLVEGSEPKPWTPSGLTCVESLEWQTRGKNLRTIGEDRHTQQIVNYGKSTVTQPLLPGTYTISTSAFSKVDSIFVFDTHGVQIARSNGKNFVTFNLDAETGIWWQFYSNTPIFGGVDMKCQLEAGSVATPYEPYAGTTTPIDLKGHKACSLPDGIADEVVSDGVSTWLEGKLGVVTVDKGKTHEWAAAQTPRGIYRYNKSYVLPFKKYSYHASGIAYPYQWNMAYSDGDVGDCFATDSYASFFSDKPTIDEFLSTFPDSGVTFIAELEAPERIPLDPVTLPELPGLTSNVWSETNMPEVQTEMTYVQDINKVIGDIQKKVAATEAAIVKGI